MAVGRSGSPLRLYEPRRVSLVPVRQCENADLTRAEERHHVRVLEAGSETDLPLESPSRQASSKGGGEHLHHHPAGRRRACVTRGNAFSSQHLHRERRQRAVVHPDRKAAARPTARQKSKTGSDAMWRAAPAFQQSRLGARLHPDRVAPIPRACRPREVSRPRAMLSAKHDSFAVYGD